MKIAVITDTHFGARKGSDMILESQLRFFRNQFIPELRSAGITNILHLGDFFDNRVHINSKILNTTVKLLSEEMADFQIYIMVGNHDSYFESTIDVNSIEPLSLISNVHIVKTITQMEFDSRKFVMVPWIVNEETAKAEIEKIEADVCVGHFELKSFDMFKNKICENGFDYQYFLNKFKLTLSGHFHTRSMRELNSHRIHYIGNAYHLTRNDIGDERGYAVLDTETLDLTLIDNRESMKFISLKYPQKVTKEMISGNTIDVYADYNSVSEEEMLKYISEIESLGPAQPVTKKLLNSMNYSTTADIQIGSVSDFMNEYIQALDIENKDKILKMLMSLYDECKTEI